MQRASFQEYQQKKSILAHSISNTKQPMRQGYLVLQLSQLTYSFLNSSMQRKKTTTYKRNLGLHGFLGLQEMISSQDPIKMNILLVAQAMTI